MTNRETDFTNGPVTLGAPTLTINPPAEVAEKASQASEKEKSDDDDAEGRNKS